MEFTQGEQAVIDQMISLRTDKLDKPPWMQSHRATAIKVYVRKALAELPKDPVSQKSARYHASRRMAAWTTKPDGIKKYFAMHEADVDDLPLCPQLKPFFEEAKDWKDGGVEFFGPGLVTCGHCANANS